MNEKNSHEAHLEAIAQALSKLAHTNDLFTAEGDTAIDNAIIQLSLLKYSGDSDADNFTILRHYHRLTIATLLEMLDYSQS